MSFFSKFKVWFKKLFGDEAQWAHIALNTLTVCAPLIQGAVALTDPALAPVTSGILTVVKNDLTTAVTLLDQGGSAPTLTTVLNDIKSNLASLLAAGEVKNPATVAQITAITNTVISEIEAILAAIPSINSSATTATPIAASVAEPATKAAWGVVPINDLASAAKPA